MAKRNTTLEKKITFRLSDQQLLELERYAEREDLPVSFVVRKLVGSFLEEQRDYGFRGGNIQMTGLNGR